MVETLGRGLTGSRSTRERGWHVILYPVTALLIFGYFLFFTLPSFERYFDADDMYALYFAWKKPLSQILSENLLFWQGNFRPLGAFYYRWIYDFANFNPVPFHAAHLAFCALNLGISFWILRLLSHSDRVAALGALLMAFHSRLIEIWFSTTIIFDVLCFTFTWLTFGLYVIGRQRGALTWPRIACILFFYLCALQSKEMAVCLPVLMLAYDLLFDARDAWVARRRLAACYVAMAFITLAYTWGKLHRPEMMNNPGYTPVYSFGRFAETWNSYLGALFVMKHVPATSVTMTVLCALAAAAIAVRSRRLMFAWIAIVFGLLPVSFAPTRGPFVMYVSLVGWALYAAIVLVAAQDIVVRRHPRFRTAVACVVFLLLGWRVGKVHLHERRTGDYVYLSQIGNPLRALMTWMKANYPTMPPHSRILFLKDDIPAEWTVLFAMHIFYRDQTLAVDRARIGVPGRTPERDEQRGSAVAESSGYNYVFTLDDGKYKRVYSLPPEFRPLD